LLNASLPRGKWGGAEGTPRNFGITLDFDGKREIVGRHKRRRTPKQKTRGIEVSSLGTGSPPPFA